MPNSCDKDHKEEADNILMDAHYDGVQVYRTRAPLVRSLTNALRINFEQYCNFDATYDPMHIMKHICINIEKYSRGEKLIKSICHYHIAFLSPDHCLRSFGQSKQIQPADYQL